MGVVRVAGVMAVTAVEGLVAVNSERCPLLGWKRAGAWCCRLPAAEAEGQRSWRLPAAEAGSRTTGRQVRHSGEKATGIYTASRIGIDLAFSPYLTPCADADQPTGDDLCPVLKSLYRREVAQEDKT
ncbi:hypothetical protein GUJ93_ZPchr0012g19355 [Zizania palustris]|uniref:Uncharacterized protein n=1 Tax=Zizania palustris TaxID=103762 RepID=A0A8J5WHE7_ZIZPA|nr:hypothetical protein GUJ93_ZPchr0012g19355 [Zizania palustris]